MIVDAIFSAYIRQRLKRIDSFRNFPIESQKKVFLELLNSGLQTEFGKYHRFSSIKSIKDFQSLLPLQDYDSLTPFIQATLEGEKNVLWPGQTKWFAKSSGTTGGRMKTIPVTKDSLHQNHYAGGKDLLASYHANFPNRKLYSKKHLILGGSNALQSSDNQAIVADLSAIIIENLPIWTEFRRVPEKEIVLHSDWEEKLNRMAESSIKEDVAILAGVPSWMTSLGKRILELTGKNNLHEVWPNLELYIHGGMNILPYRQTLDTIIGNEEMNYVESYNSSEGYFGLQDGKAEDGLLLLTDSQVFYEFIPMDSYNGTHSAEVKLLEDIELHKEYALVITTSAGLWRYIVGDTLSFVSTYPFRFKVTGRTAHFINAFGEKAVIMHFEKAIARWRKQYNVEFSEYTVAPYFDFTSGIGGHEWAIEMSNEVLNLKELELGLDYIMREINSDYDVKRHKDINMLPLKIRNLKAGTFVTWMKKSGKFGGQHKIPRIQNDRKFMDEILKSES
jgi:hypothetical protein